MEAKGITIGVDEVGMGSAAGPLLICAAAFAHQDKPNSQINDSKKLTAATRRNLCFKITDEYALAIGIGMSPVSLIVNSGMNAAWTNACRKALEDVRAALARKGHILELNNKIIIDGPPKKDFKQFIPKELRHVKLEMCARADGIYWQVGAASIVAKVVRDGIMTAIGQEYPEYYWNENAGYLTNRHRYAILKYGLTPHHRTNWNIKPSKDEVKWFAQNPDISFERWETHVLKMRL